MKEDNKTIFPAHIREDGTIQSVEEHCRQTASIAASCLTGVHFDKTGYLSGLVHDMGKYTEEYKNYIELASSGLKVTRGSVVHSFTGVRYILDCFHKEDLSFDDLTSEIVAFAVGAHHGLFDAVNPKGESGFQYRLQTHQENYSEAMNNYLSLCSNEEEIVQLFNAAKHEIAEAWSKIISLVDSDFPEKANQEMVFYAGLIARLILSAVIEGDRRDTAIFMEGIKQDLDSESKKTKWEEMLENTEKYIERMSDDSPIGIARKSISKQCKDFAKKPSGLYRLNVPTGGGKTLSALRYALEHANKYNKRRIYYIAPLISILEQNADVIRKAVQSEELVLEHHSNVIIEDEGKEYLSKRELSIETWDAPIIVTTLVQLLNTLFSHKSSSIRRFQALTNSVLIIDEVQTVPSNMISLFNLTMNFLSSICGTTILLCSATQPCLEEVNHALRLEKETPVPYDSELWNCFARTQIQESPSLKMDDIPEYISSQLEENNSLLVICNKKNEANELYKTLSGGDYNCFHLSASMCMAHRRRIMEQIKESLKKAKEEGKKTLCISTQVIEAGVDISFDCVIRFAAGMDSVIQAAGRCNRNGESLGRAPVYILKCTDEKLKGLSGIQAGKDATEKLLYKFNEKPDLFSDDLASDEAIRYYYRALYQSMKRGFQDYPTKEHGNLVDLMSSNIKYSKSKQHHQFLSQALLTAGKQFKVFDEDSIEILVPYREGKGIINDLEVAKSLTDIKNLTKKAKAYSVSIYDFEKRRLMEKGGLYYICDDSMMVLEEGFYNEETGVELYPMNNVFLEV